MAGFITEPELDAALPHILAAPKDEGVINTICRRPGFKQREFPETLEVTPQDGVIGDRAMTHPWLKLEDGTANPSIQVCILPTRIYSAVCQRGSEYPGDTIIADLNMTEANLPAGSQIQIGSAIVEVSPEFNNGCVKWRARYGQASYDWINRPEHRALRLRGLLCRVVHAGSFTKSDRLIPIRPAA